MDKRVSPAEWRAYYTEKRILHQWMQLDLLAGTQARRVLEIGPAYGLVTAMLANAGYEVATLDRLKRAFDSPAGRHIEADITALSGADIVGYDAILCCRDALDISIGTLCRGYLPRCATAVRSTSSSRCLTTGSRSRLTCTSTHGRCGTTSR